MRIAVLGGYGNAGQWLIRLLAPNCDHDFTVLGRDRVRAAETAARLSADTGARIRGDHADASDRDALLRAFAGQDLCLVASSTSEKVGTVARAVLDSGADYFDLQLSTREKIQALRLLQPEIVQAGRCFVTDGGIHPGLPGALVRFAGERLAGLREAYVGASLAIDWAKLTFSEATMTEFVAEMKAFDPRVLRKGAWVRGMRYARSFEFGPDIGRKSCAPMAMEEMNQLPEQIPTLESAGFYIAGFGFVSDYVLMPLSLLLLALFPRHPRPAARLFVWGLNRFASGRNRCAVLLEAAGADGGRLQVRLRDDDGYHFTAAAAAACVGQLIEGGRRPGLFTQGEFVDPGVFLVSLERFGIEIEER